MHPNNNSLDIGGRMTAGHRTATEISGPNFAKVQSRLDEFDKDMSTLISSALNLKDRIFGCEPQACGAAPDEGPVSGILPEAFNRIGSVGRKISTLHQILDEIDQRL